MIDSALFTVLSLLGRKFIAYFYETRKTMPKAQMKASKYHLKPAEFVIEKPPRFN